MSANPVRYGMYIQVSAIVGGILDIFVPLFWSLWFPLTLWYFGPKTEFADWHGREAVRFQLMMMAYVFGGLLGWFTLAALLVSTGEIGALMAASSSFVLFFGLLIFEVVTLVMPIIAALRAREGEYYVYPQTFSPRRNQHRNPIATTS